MAKKGIYLDEEGKQKVNLTEAQKEELRVINENIDANLMKLNTSFNLLFSIPVISNIFSLEFPRGSQSTRASIISVKSNFTFLLSQSFGNTFF